MLFVVLPAYNEAGAIANLLEALEQTCLQIPHRIIVVDDGSTDQTLKIVQEYSHKFKTVEVIQHEVNKGLGEALKTGFQAAIDQSEAKNKFSDIVITMDADNTHPPELIPKLITKINEGADIAIASRYVDGSCQYGLSYFRRFLSWCAGIFMHLFFPIDGVRDYSCGYRAYRLSVLQEGSDTYHECFIESRNFAGMVELLLKTAPFCEKIAEVPLQLHYERKRGSSKMRIGATIFGYFQLIYRLKWKNRRAYQWVEE